MIGPKLRRVSIDVSSSSQSQIPPPTVESCSRFVAKLPPCVQTFLLETEFRTPSMLSDSLSDWTITARNLTSFRSPNNTIRADAFLHLASLPQLQAIEIVISTDWSSDLVEHTFMGLPPMPFPSLASLGVVVDANIDFGFQLIRAIHASHLGSISLRTSQATAPDLSHFIAVLPTTRFAGALRYLELAIINKPFELQDNLPSPLPVILHAADLAPLLTLELKDFRAHGFEVAISDELLYKMARAWPSLRTLDLCWYGIGRDSPYAVTLPGLLPLTRLCPHLFSLGVALDATYIPPQPIPEIRPAFGGGQGELCLFKAGYGRLPANAGGEAFAAGWLADCFPSLVSVQSCWCPASLGETDATQWAPAAAWRRVNELLPHMRRVRTQERNWAAHRGPPALVRPPRRRRVFAVCGRAPLGPGRGGADRARVCKVVGSLLHARIECIPV